MSDLPNALEWTRPYARWLQSALDGALIAADVLPHGADPLHWVIVLRAESTWTKPLVRIVRDGLRTWCELNEAHLGSVAAEGTTIRASILLRGLDKTFNRTPGDPADEEAAKRAAFWRHDARRRNG